MRKGRGVPSQGEPGAIVLLYHGVTDVESRGIENFSGKHIPADEFERQMRYLARHADVVPLRSLAEDLERGLQPDPATVAVTFDDSFENNRRVALPILLEHGIPATFFITSGFVGTRRRYWVDRLEHCINLTDRQRIDDPTGELGTIFELRTAAQKIAAVIEIKRAMKRMEPARRDGTLSRLQEETAVSDNGDDVPNYRNLDWGDVRAMAASPGIEIGGHTVNHEILAYLAADAQEREIAGCLQGLEAGLGSSVDLFSYPEGQRDHFDDTTIAILKEHGVQICPTAIAGLNPTGTDPFHLRRIMVGFMDTPFPFPLKEGGR